MQPDEQKTPRINPNNNNDIGSPLNTGSNVKKGHHVDEHNNKINGQNGDIQSETVLEKDNQAEPDLNIKNEFDEHHSKNGINDPDANKTPHPGPNDGNEQN